MKGERITIAKVEASEFHRLVVAQVEHVPGVGLVRVQGKNASGKSSFLRAIMVALGGAGEVLPDAIRDGADTGEVRVTLTNGFSVRRRFTEAAPKGYLTVEGPDGGKHAQGKLAEWLGTGAFDPSAFFALAPNRQRDLLFSLSSIPTLADDLARLRARHGVAYDMRTPVISELRVLSKTEKPAGDRPAAVSVQSSMERLRALREQEGERRRLREEVERLKREEDSARNQIEQLEAKLREWHATLEAVSEQRHAAIQRLEASSDPSSEIEAVQERIADADRHRGLEAKWEQWDQAVVRRAQLSDLQAELSRELELLKLAEVALLQDAGIPVDGLSFAESGEPLLNGRALAVASGAERVRLAVQVAVAADPDLRVVLLDEEANALDDDGLEALHALAVEHGFQVWAARVATDPRSEVVVVDGRATDGQEAFL